MNFEIFDAEEFIVTNTQHIPDKSFQMVRYYGWYSNRSNVEWKGRPGLAICSMVGLHYLKHAFGESDESVVERLLENPY